MTSQKKQMSIKEAASFAGKSNNTIRRAIKKGTLTATLTDGKYQILVSSLVALYGPTQEEPTQEEPTHAPPTQEEPTHADLPMRPVVLL